MWEACLSASKHKLDNFTLLIDYNKQQSWGDVSEILPLEPYADKFRAFGFSVAEADGHDVSSLRPRLKLCPQRRASPPALFATR